jgi:PAS domain S-box-containing protein
MTINQDKIIRQPARQNNINPLPVPKEVGSNLIQKLVVKLRPANSIPVWMRYGLTIIIILVCFCSRFYLQGVMFYSPYLLFLPGVVLSALLFDRRSGCLAVLFGGLLAFYYFVAPYHTFTGKDVGSLIGLSVYLIVGLLTALILETLRNTVDELGKAVADHELLTTIIKFSSDAIIGKSLTGEILSWNLGAERIFGYTASEAIGKNIRLIIPPERATEEDEIIDKIRSGRAVEHFETIRITKAGQRVDISANISPIYDAAGKIIGASKIARDITPQKEAMRELEDANERLQESNKQLEEFTHIVSHDLKEPVRGIDGYCSILLEDYRDRLDPEGQDKLDKIKNMSMRINELISDLLKYSRVDKEGSGLEEIDLDEVIRSVLDLLAPQTDKDSVSITVTQPFPKVYCSKAHIAEIFRNLIMNGIKYNTSRPKKIHIGFIQGHERHPAGHVFFVKDNGIGIPPEARESVFKMFKRLHGREQYGGGTGAGLAIVKKLVERHGGEIWIEPNKEGGSTFFFFIDCT